MRFLSTWCSFTCLRFGKAASSCELARRKFLHCYGANSDIVPDESQAGRCLSCEGHKESSFHPQEGKVLSAQRPAWTWLILRYAIDLSSDSERNYEQPKDCPGRRQRLSRQNAGAAICCSWFGSDHSDSNSRKR